MRILLYLVSKVHSVYLIEIHICFFRGSLWHQLIIKIKSYSDYFRSETWDGLECSLLRIANHKDRIMTVEKAEASTCPMTAPQRPKRGMRKTALPATTRLGMFQRYKRRLGIRVARESTTAPTNALHSWNTIVRENNIEKGIASTYCGKKIW